MLSCRDVTARASRLIDGELTLIERFGVRMHLILCGECRRFIGQMTVLIRALSIRAWPGDAYLTDEQVDRILQALPPGQPSPRSSTGPEDLP